MLKSRKVFDILVHCLTVNDADAPLHPLHLEMHNYIPLKLCSLSVSPYIHDPIFIVLEMLQFSSGHCQNTCRLCAIAHFYKSCNPWILFLCCFSLPETRTSNMAIGDLQCDAN